jgi:hypothetical protein
MLDRFFVDFDFLIDLSYFLLLSLSWIQLPLRNGFAEAWTLFLVFLVIDLAHERTITEQFFVIRELFF